jgi:hypothetical protein
VPADDPLDQAGWASRLAPPGCVAWLTQNTRVRSRAAAEAADSLSAAWNTAASSWMTSTARPMPKNPPRATVSPARMSWTASRADTILPVEPDRAVGTMDLMLIGPRS